MAISNTGKIFPWKIMVLVIMCVMGKCKFECFIDMNISKNMNSLMFKYNFTINWNELKQLIDL